MSGGGGQEANGSGSGPGSGAGPGAGPGPGSGVRRGVMNGLEVLWECVLDDVPGDGARWALWCCCCRWW